MCILNIYLDLLNDSFYQKTKEDTSKEKRETIAVLRTVLLYPLTLEARLNFTKIPNR